MPGSWNTRHGLGAAHQAARQAALATLRPGADCCPYTWICGGQPMWPTPAAAAAGAHAWMGNLDLDDWPGRIFGGPQITRLAHATCNRSAGASLGNRLRAMGITRTDPRPPSRTRPLPRQRQRPPRW